MRLAAANYCAFTELLAHIGIDGRYAVILDFELETGEADGTAEVARMPTARVQSLTFSSWSLTEAALTVRITL